MLRQCARRDVSSHIGRSHRGSPTGGRHPSVRAASQKVRPAATGLPSSISHSTSPLLPTICDHGNNCARASPVEIVVHVSNAGLSFCAHFRLLSSTIVNSTLGEGRGSHMRYRSVHSANARPFSRCSWGGCSFFFLSFFLRPNDENAAAVFLNIVACRSTMCSSRVRCEGTGSEGGGEIPLSLLMPLSE